MPSEKEWFHEIKYDGYRIPVEREDDRVRLITKGGYDWTGRFPWIVEAARRNRTRRFVIDGEAVVLCLDGIADFDALHSGKHNEEVELCAFDMLAIDGEDLRELPLSMRKTMLVELGHTVVAEAGDFRTGLTLASTAEIDVPILDVSLGANSSAAIAEVLQTRNIPFVFATGYGSAGLPADHKERPALRKPISD